jgi:dienelactone hydrolase
MAHGFGGLPESFDAFARDIAATGYVVAAPAFPLTNADHPGEELGLFDAVEQPADLAFVAAELVAASATLTDSLFGVIDGGALAVLGHSLGGSTAHALAHSDCCPVPGLRAAVLAAAFPGILSPNLVETGPPTLILHGTADATVPFALAAPLFETLPVPRFLVGLAGAGHGPMITSQIEPPITERAAAELATLGFLEAEFRGAIAGLPAALEALRGDGHLVVVERCLPETQTCDPACTEVAHSVPPAVPPDQNPGRARFRVDRLDAPSDTIIVASGLMNPAASVPAIDPMANGIHVRLEDSGGSLVDVSIPGTWSSGVACEPGDGWSDDLRPDGAVTWRYRNHSNRLPPLCQPNSARGVRAVTIRDRTADPAVEAYAFTSKLRHASMLRALVDPPIDLSLTVSLASQLERGVLTEAATAGQCAHMRFFGAPIPSSPPVPFCSQRRRGGLLVGLRCKGP